MKYLKILMALLLFVTLSCAVCVADVLRCGDFEYEIADDGTAILGLYKGAEGADVVIPIEFDGHPIMAASDNPFWQTPIASITVAEDHPYLMVIDGVLYGKLDGKLIYYPPQAPAGVLVMPKGITSFGKHALYNCTNIIDIRYE